MSEHNTNVSEAGERAYAFCRSCSWRTGWLTPDDAWGLTFWDRGKCREMIERHRSEGVYGPPSLEGSIMNPGFGGMNWGGASFDPQRQLLIANVMINPVIVRLVRSEEAAQLGAVDWKKQASGDSGAGDGVRR